MSTSARRKPVLPTGWQPDDDTFARFKAFLKTSRYYLHRRRIQRQPRLDAHTDQIRTLLPRLWQKSRQPLQWSDDPEIKKAIESLPRAQSLLQQVQRVLAQRGARG